MTDESVAVREEDAFDVGAVAAWLRENAAPEFADVVAGAPEVRQFPGGASNLTYLLRLDSGRDLILRRPPGGTKAKGAHDMGREYRIQAVSTEILDQCITTQSLALRGLLCSEHLDSGACGQQRCSGRDGTCSVNGRIPGD